MRDNSSGGILETSGVEDYFRSVLGLKLRIVPYQKSGMPYYLGSLYSCGRTEIEGRSLLLCAIVGQEAPSPAQLISHAAELQSLTKLEPVFVLPGLSSWDRGRLIEGRISFVVPGRQLYLPTLLIDLREHFERERARPDRLSYPAQLLVLLQLLKGKVEGKTVRELSRELPYSATTMSRAVRELHGSGLVGSGEGKARPLHFTAAGRALWTAALPQLRSPVKAVWYQPSSSRHVPCLVSGTPALAKLSMLNEAEDSALALSIAEAKLLIEKGMLRKQLLCDGDTRIEVWGYDPRLLVEPKAECVDSLSLYLSLAGENDERVRKYLNTLVEGLF